MPKAWQAALEMRFDVHVRKPEKNFSTGTHSSASGAFAA
jgi:hypothetical protein